MMKFRASVARTFSVLSLAVAIAAIILIFVGVRNQSHPSVSVGVAYGSGGVWLLCTVWIGWMVRVGVGRRWVTPGLLILLASLASLWSGIQNPWIEAAYLVFALTNISLFYGPLTATILCGFGGLLHGALYLWQGHPQTAALVVVSTIIVSALILWIKLEFREWSRQSRLFDQARWAASEFVSVNTRMQDNLDRTAGLTRMRERIRVAREIHDTVGYTLTAVLVQIHAAEEVLKANPNELPPRLRHLSDMVRASIQEVRQEVSMLRDESIVERTGTSRWRRLCEGFADSTGVRVHTNLTDQLEEVDPLISETVYRLIQESLTNAYRHGRADYVDVSMSWESDERLILFRVSDNGKGAMSLSPGNGLTGMRERVGELGGSVVWQSAPGRGFDLGVDIPWDGGAYGSD